MISPIFWQGDVISRVFWQPTAGWHPGRRQPRGGMVPGKAETPRWDGVREDGSPWRDGAREDEGPAVGEAFGRALDADAGEMLWGEVRPSEAVLDLWRPTGQNTEK